LCWLELARRRGRSTLTSEQIAASLASNPVLVRRSLAPLREAGIVVSGRGPGSGWSLGRPAEEISLRDVYDGLGSEETFALHPHEPNQECPVGFGIRPVLSEVYAGIEAAIVAELESRSVAEVLDTLLREHPLPA
jgi:DNA-binding IscR family transcriptional regulator